MHRNILLSLLKSYAKRHTNEEKTVDKFIEFVKAFDTCFERSLQVGHITGSAWLLNSTLDSVFLVHHKKLDKWLQPGGHVDGSPDVLTEAIREAVEETGIKKLSPLSANIFDLDIHTIPERDEEPEHFHYDVRFLLQAHDDKFLISEESNAGVWLPLDKIKEYSQEESVLRMVRKSPRLSNLKECQSLAAIA